MGVYADTRRGSLWRVSTPFPLSFLFSPILSPPRVKLAVHKETGECVAVKIVEVGEGEEANKLTHEALRKEASVECDLGSRALIGIDVCIQL